MDLLVFSFVIFNLFGVNFQFVVIFSLFLAFNFMAKLA
ncbi:hypothetical protein RB151_038680 [Providencia rettgeri]|nr:hypothetical protein RB151_038680 [Providencia rettgeri]